MPFPLVGLPEEGRVMPMPWALRVNSRHYPKVPGTPQFGWVGTTCS
jgi:hypothetical protein